MDNRLAELMNQYSDLDASILEWQGYVEDAKRQKRAVDNEIALILQQNGQMLEDMFVLTSEFTDVVLGCDDFSGPGVSNFYLLKRVRAEKKV